MKFHSFQGLEQETAVTESREEEQLTQGGQRVTPEPCQSQAARAAHSACPPHVPSLCRSKLSHPSSSAEI